MTGIAQFFISIQVAGGFAQRFGLFTAQPGSGGDVVGDGQPAAGAQDAGRFGQELGDAGEMVGGQAAGDEVEAVVGEGEGLGNGRFGDDVVEAAFLSQPGCFSQHLRGDVAGGDVGDVGSEGEGGVPRAGGDVENAPIGLGLGQFD